MHWWLSTSWTSSRSLMFTLMWCDVNKYGGPFAQKIFCAPDKMWECQTNRKCHCWQPNFSPWAKLMKHPLNRRYYQIISTGAGVNCSPIPHGGRKKAPNSLSKTKIIETPRRFPAVPYKFPIPVIVYGGNFRQKKRDSPRVHSHRSAVDDRRSFKFWYRSFCKSTCRSLNATRSAKKTRHTLAKIASNGLTCARAARHGWMEPDEILYGHTNFCCSDSFGRF